MGERSLGTEEYKARQSFCNLREHLHIISSTDRRVVGKQKVYVCYADIVNIQCDAFKVFESSEYHLEPRVFHFREIF